MRWYYGPERVRTTGLLGVFVRLLITVETFVLSDILPKQPSGLFFLLSRIILNEEN
jgi:hypothetical protein